MDVRQIAVIAVGGASLLWMVSNVFINDIGRSWRIVDKLPESRFSQWLFGIGVLRARGQREQYPPMLWVEVGLFSLSCVSITLGFVNLVSAIMCTSFPEVLRSATCAYGAEMASRCVDNLRGCVETECGGANFLSCGGQTCNANICTDSIATYLGPVPEALEIYQLLDGQVLTVQAMGSALGFLVPWVVLGTSSLIASSRSNRDAQRVTALISGLMTPVYIGLAGVMLNYGTYMKRWCASRKSGASYRCEDSMAEGLFEALCKGNELGVEEAYGIVLTTACTLVMQACTCASYAGVMYAFRDSLHHQFIARLTIESNRQSPQEMVDLALRQSAILKRQMDANTSLVHKGSFLPLPGLVNVCRGHRGRVTCLKVLRVGAQLCVWSGAADGTLRMWDLRSGKPLLVIQAHSVEVVGIDVLTVEAEAEQKQCTEVLSRTLNPKWAASANKFKFEIADAHQMICIRMFAATQGGDVQLGNSAIRMHDAFGGGLDTGQHMVVSLDLPLLLLLPDEELVKQAAKLQKTESDIVDEMNAPAAGASAHLALLDAGVVEKRGGRTDLKYRKTGSVAVSLEYRPMEGLLEVHVVSAQFRSSKVPKKQMNPYAAVMVKSPPLLRAFTAGGKAANMFDVQSQRLVHAFQGHSSLVTCLLARRIRGRDYLFTGSLDKTVRMWSIESGDTVRTFRGHDDGITSIILSRDALQAKKLLDDRAFRGKANLVVRTKYWQNAAFEMDLEVKILALEGLQMQGKRARQPKLLLRVEVSPGHEATTEELVYSDKEGVWKMSGMTHFFGDVQLTDNVDITLVVRAGKKGGRTREGYLGHIESSIGLIDRRICTEVGLDADCLTSSYPVCFDQPQQVFLFTGSGLRDGHIRMFNTMPRNDSSVPIKIFKGHTQTVTGMSLCDAYGKRCLISCSWDGSCKLWSVQAEDKPIALETFVVGDGNLHNNTVTMTYIRMYLWVVVGSSDRSVRLIKVSKDAAVPKSFRRDLATWLDSPPVFAVIIFCIMLDVITGVVTDFAIQAADKDCFGRDSQGALFVTIFVLFIFVTELCLRMFAKGARFWVPIRDTYWNFLEVLIVFGSASVAAIKAMSDETQEAPFPPGAETPVISCNMHPDLCEGYCGESLSSSSLGATRKGMTAARMLTRVAIGMRLVRAVMVASRIAKSFLNKKVCVYNGHEGPVNDLAVCKVDGKLHMVTVSEDSYLRLWDIEPF